MEKTLCYTIQPGGQLSGDFTVPGDKSISHRAVMLGAIAEGKTHVTGFLEGEDSKATIAIFRSMGVNIEHPATGELFIHGVGKFGLKAPDTVLDCGNSGTTMRLLSGLLSAMPFELELIGDESLMKRPMKRIADPLNRMNAKIRTAENGCPPIHVYPTDHLEGIEFDMLVPSAQVKSAILLAGLYAKGMTKVNEKVPSRDHTERMLQAFSYRVEKQAGSVSVCGDGKLKGTDISIPADISSAAFFIVGATIGQDSEIVLENIGVNPTRSGIIEILTAMGADIFMENHRTICGEEVANIRVKSARLKGIDIPQHLVPLAIDEFPAIFVAAACAEGATTLRGATELRVKESDRIETMAKGLRILGVEVEPYPDGIRIVGQTSFSGGHIDSYHDHRITMSFAMAALRAKEPITISGCEVVATSFPGFVNLAHDAGLLISEERK